MASQRPRLILPEQPHSHAINAILEFLHEHRLEKSLQALQEEAQIEYEPSSNGSVNVLLNALQAYRSKKEEINTNERETDPAELARRSLQKIFDRYDVVAKVPDASSELCLTQLHTGNVLALDWQHSADDDGRPARVLASAAADRSVCLYNFDSDSVVRRLGRDIVPSPVLALNFHPLQPNLLALGCMDGSVHIVDTNLDDKSGAAVKQQSFFEHDSKQVLYVEWLPLSGDLLATAGADGSLCIFRRGVDARWTLVRRMRFSGSVEAMAWLCGRGGSHRLAVAARDNSQLRLFDASTLTECTRLKINSNSETSSASKVGTNVLNLSAAAAQATSHLLLASTDESRTLLFDSSCPIAVQNYFGACNDEYSTPRTSFACNDICALSTSQPNCVVSWDLRSQRVLQRLQTHSKLVRDLTVHPVSDELATASYDKTVRLYSLAGGSSNV